MCDKYLPKDDGTLLVDRRTSLPMLRTREPNPCHKCPKIPLSIRAAGGDPRDMRKHACDLSEQDRRAWAYYRKCRAVGRFPDDPLVDFFALALRDVYDMVEREPLRRLAIGLEELARAVNGKV